MAVKQKINTTITPKSEIKIRCEGSELIPWRDIQSLQGNLKSIDRAGMAKLKRSLIDKGFSFPFLIWKHDGKVYSIDGVHRGLALADLATDGWAVPDVLPAVTIEAKDADQAKELILLASSRYAEIDDSGLLEFIADLDANYLKEIVDLADVDLAHLLEVQARDYDKADDIPATPPTAYTRPGDLYTLRDHRVLCGDSANRDHLDQLLNGARIHLAITDPPYNINNQPRGANPLETLPEGAQAKARTILNDNMTAQEYKDRLLSWYGNIAYALDPGRSFYIFGGYINLDNYPQALRESDLYFSQILVWLKEGPVLNHRDYMATFEFIYYGWKEGAAHQFHGPSNVYDSWRITHTNESGIDLGKGVRLKTHDGQSVDILPSTNQRRGLHELPIPDEGITLFNTQGLPTDVWRVKKVTQGQMVHLTEKPVELSIRAIEYSSTRGENILDLFGGSGSTLIGAELTTRHGYIMELDPLYSDVIVQRYLEYTGDITGCSLIRDGQTIPLADIPYYAQVVEE